MTDKPQFRLRLNTSTTTKGIRTTDCTLEIIGADAPSIANIDEFLRLQQDFQTKVDTLYPPPGPDISK